MSCLWEQQTFFSSVTRWCKKFKSGVDSVEDAPHAPRPKNGILQKIVEKVTNLVAADARFTTGHIAKCVGTSIGAAHTILRRDLKMKKISARLIPYLLLKVGSCPNDDNFVPIFFCPFL